MGGGTLNPGSVSFWWPSVNSLGIMGSNDKSHTYIYIQAYPCKPELDHPFAQNVVSQNYVHFLGGPYNEDYSI